MAEPFAQHLYSAARGSWSVWRTTGVGVAPFLPCPTLVDAVAGGTRNFTGAGSARPKLQLGGANGWPYLEFDGVANVMVTSAVLSTFITNTAYEYFVVWRAREITTTGAVDIWQRDAVLSDNSGVFGLHLKVVSGKYYVNAYNFVSSPGHETPDIEIQLDTWYFTRVRHVSGVLSLWLNDGPEVSVSSGTTSVLTSALRLGAGWATGGVFSKVDVADLLICNAVLGTPDRIDAQLNLTAPYALPMSTR
jgi:hypothetical protein